MFNDFNLWVKWTQLGKIFHIDASNYFRNEVHLIDWLKGRKNIVTHQAQGGIMIPSMMVGKERKNVIDS